MAAQPNPLEASTCFTRLESFLPRPYPPPPSLPPIQSPRGRMPITGENSGTDLSLHKHRIHLLGLRGPSAPPENPWLETPTATSRNGPRVDANGSVFLSPKWIQQISVLACWMLWGLPFLGLFLTSWCSFVEGPALAREDERAQAGTRYFPATSQSHSENSLCPPATEHAFSWAPAAFRCPTNVASIVFGPKCPGCPPTSSGCDPNQLRLRTEGLVPCVPRRCRRGSAFPCPEALGSEHAAQIAAGPLVDTAAGSG